MYVGSAKNRKRKCLSEKGLCPHCRILNHFSFAPLFKAYLNKISLFLLFLWYA